MRTKLFFVLVILALVCSAPASAVPAAAQAQPQQPKPTPAAGSAGEYMLMLAVPQIDPEQLPAHMGLEEASVYVQQFARQLAEPYLPELMGFVKEGRIASFEVQPDRLGIKITLNDPTVLTELRQLKGIEGIYPAAKAVTCSQDAAKNVAKLVSSLSYGPALSTLAPAAVASDPALTVYHQPGSNWGQVLVKTTANTSLVMEIWHNGSLAATVLGASFSDGTYTFYPFTNFCGDSPWSLYSEDTVKVTAHGSTTTMIVSPMTINVDPVANTVSGVTVGTSMVNVTLHTVNADGCTYTSTAKSVVSSGDGKYSVAFNDFNRRAYATVSVPDINSNTTTYNVNAFGLSVFSTYTNFTWRTDEHFTVTVTRGANVISSVIFTQVDSGNYSIDLGWGNLQIGDVIAVSSAHGSMSTAVTSLTMSLNPATDQITGTTTPNRLVMAAVNRFYYATCNLSSACAKATSNATTGAYTISTPLGQGDQANVRVFDAEGNYQYGPDSKTPVIFAFPKYSEAHGTWPNTNTLTATLKDSGGNVKDTQSNLDMFGSGDFDVYFSADMVAGDKIEVTDGVILVTMTVQTLTGRVNSAQSSVAGTAGSGHLVDRFYDQRTPMSGNSYCQEQQVNGSYSHTFSGAQFGPWDWANVYLVGPEGHYTTWRGVAFSIYFYLQENFVRGNTETPEVSVTVTWKRGASTIGTITTNSYFYMNNLFEANFNGTDFIQPGDVIQVTTGDGNSATLTAPNFTVNIDAAGNRVYGVAPASQLLSAGLAVRTSANGSNGASYPTTSDASGNYSLSTVGWKTYNCDPLSPPGVCTWAYAWTWLPSGHEVDVESTWPSDVAADSYEPDNGVPSASAYLEAQHHTFDSYGDSDYVKFTVPQSDVDNHVQYVIKTSNLGPYLDTVLYLLDTDGATLLAMNDNDGNLLSSRITWTPSKAGTYYIYVSPASPDLSQYCGAFYDLLILSNYTYAPATFK